MNLHVPSEIMSGHDGPAAENPVTLVAELSVRD